MKLSQKGLGSALGILAGACWLVMMVGTLAFGWWSDAVMSIGPLHPWFSLTWSGTVWMVILHVVAGYILGWIFAWLYNKFAK